MTTTLFLTAATGAGTGAGPTSFLIGLLPWLAVFVIFYVLMIRPQQKRVKDHQTAVSAIKKGDEIVTAGGIRGRVSRVIDDNEAEVEIAQGVKVRVVKATIAQVLTPATKPAND
nr:MULTISPECIES: preprotein translocase subunit YajC [Sphingomonas]